MKQPPDDRRAKDRERQRKSRKLKAAGLCVLEIVVPEAELADTLVATGELSPLHADDRASLAKAVEQHLAGLVVAIIET